jgi:hypothetical protein
MFLRHDRLLQQKSFFFLYHGTGGQHSGSGSSTCPSSSSLNIAISEKLTLENFLLWQTQVLPEIYGAQLYGYLDGSIEAPEKEMNVKDKDGVETTITNPNYARWVAQDQYVSCMEGCDGDVCFIISGPGGAALHQAQPVS